MTWLIGLVIGGILAASAFIAIIRRLQRPLEDEMPSIKQAFKESKVVWGMWHTGDRARNLVHIGATKKILLLEPSMNNQAFMEVMDKAKHTYKEAMFEIKALTNKAISCGYEVRWHTSRLEHALSIHDAEPTQLEQELVPTSQKAWICVQFLEPSIDREHRTKVMVRKAKEPEEYHDYVEEFNSIWKQARVPEPYEYSLAGS